MKHPLFALENLGPGEVRPARLVSIRIVVVRTPDGEVHALRDICPHHGAALSCGTLEQVVGGGDPGSYGLLDSYALRCPWHGLEFDLETGRCLADSTQRVRSYDVTIEDGVVVVER